jgi:hypothetical protein
MALCKIVERRVGVVVEFRGVGRSGRGGVREVLTVGGDSGVPDGRQRGEGPEFSDGSHVHVVSGHLFPAQLMEMFS